MSEASKTRPLFNVIAERMREKIETVKLDACVAAVETAAWINAEFRAGRLEVHMTPTECLRIWGMADGTAP